MQNMPEEELMEKEAALAAEVERLLPDFVNSCRDKADVVIIHQDAFAADYQDHEYALLGKAIKFAGLHGKEVRIFPEALRGTAEGQFPWDLVPDSVMTNATVAGVTNAPQGGTLKVTYKGGESEIVVDPATPVFGYGAGDASLLKPGAAIFIVAQKKPDGSLSAARVTAEKDGVKPPM